jgi:lipopolysaccharide/colanic/teichoic acid biosynthesis glycosyltransferase
MATRPERGLTAADRALKRTFDVVVSSLGLLATSWLIALAWIAATIDTRRNGFFVQERIGRNGRPFRTIKIRTMREIGGFVTSVTAARDPRVTPLGRVLRKTKLDELPQLVNVLLGHMSFVGPRPDVAGFADALEGEDRIVLSVRPGITGPATLRFRHEEEILDSQPDPERYNREVLFPEKTRLNRRYVENYRFVDDLRYIVETLAPSRRHGPAPRS